VRGAGAGRLSENLRAYSKPSADVLERRPRGADVL
jgi:hypothetical protein